MLKKRGGGSDKEVAKVSSHIFISVYINGRGFIFSCLRLLQLEKSSKKNDESLLKAGKLQINCV